MSRQVRLRSSSLQDHKREIGIEHGTKIPRPSRCSVTSHRDNVTGSCGTDNGWEGLRVGLDYGFHVHYGHNIRPASLGLGISKMATIVVFFFRVGVIDGKN